MIDATLNLFTSAELVGQLPSWSSHAQEHGQLVLPVFRQKQMFFGPFLFLFLSVSHLFLLFHPVSHLFLLFHR